MTWGKAPLLWAPSPAAALSFTLHLNHKWALDGCDPASYAGVLWCFGQVGGRWQLRHPAAFQLQRPWEDLGWHQHRGHSSWM